MGAGYKTTCHNYHTATKLERWTHIRLNIYPGIDATKQWIRLFQFKFFNLINVILFTYIIIYVYNCEFP